MRKFAVAIVTCLIAIPAVAAADPPPWAPAHGRRAKEAAMYDREGRYAEPQPIAQDERIWRGDDGHYYCKRSNGTTGLVVGAAAGAVIGHELAKNDKTLGAVLGAAGGGLIGRQIDRNNVRCR